MPKKFFTSDQHFGHANILKYESKNRINQWGRPFRSVDEMDEYLIDRWNESVNHTDEVYVLGDFSFKRSFMEEYLPLLNGRKFLIVGNHDPFFKALAGDNPSIITDAVATARELGWADISLNQRIEIAGIGKVLMNHFPYQIQVTADTPEYELRYQNLSPNRQGNESVLLHGHVHGRWKVKREQGKNKEFLMINVGVDVWSMRPVTEEELAALVFF